MSRWPTLLKATDISARGIEEDKRKNYAAAVKLYEQFEGCLIYALEHEARNDRDKDLFRRKLGKYQTRITRLKSRLAEKELSHNRSQSCPYFQSKSQRSEHQSSSSTRLCDFAQLDDRLKILDLNHDTEKKNCE